MVLLWDSRETIWWPNMNYIPIWHVLPASLLPIMPLFIISYPDRSDNTPDFSEMVVVAEEKDIVLQFILSSILKIKDR